MFGKKKQKQPPTGPRRENGPRNLSQFGLIDVPSLDELENPNFEDDNDADLEAELHQLMADEGGPRTVAKKPKSAAKNVNLDAMVAACMKDLPSGDEVSDGEDDPDLLDELQTLHGDDDEDNNDVVVKREEAPAEPVIEPLNQQCNMDCPGEDLLSKIDNRINSYTQAEQAAKASGESLRARRYARGLASLTDMRRKVINGQAVNDDDIPPAIVIKPKPVMMETTPVPSPSADPVSSSTEPKPTQTASLSSSLALLQQRREECKAQALSAKASGDKLQAVAGLRAVKECDELIAKLKNGQISSVEKLPEIKVASTPAPASEPVPQRQISRDEPIKMPENQEDIPPPDPALFGAPPAPKTVLEALEQRLVKYRQDEAKAKEEGNASRARRLGRICKQYTDAIKQHKAGRAVDVSELPTPPGFAPIPSGVPTSSVGATMSYPQPASAVASAPQVPSANAGAVPKVTPAPPQAVATAAPKKPSGPLSLRDKQLLMLEKMQSQFKEAALEAKKLGQMEQAKEYLRQYKGFDKVIEAAKGGLPVDFKTLPVPPQRRKDVDMGFEIVSREDCIQPTGDRHEMFSKLEADLIAQIKMCVRNSEHFKATGDVPSANKFQQMMEHSKKDLDTLRFAFKRGEPVPKFYYEIRAFSMVKCNSDLNDLELEFNVIQGLNYPIPNVKDAHTYVRIEFPYPKDNPYKDKSQVVKDSASPEYKFKVMVPVNPKDRYYQRVFKRQSAKVEVWAKGGFMRSDTLVGTASVKLQDLETKCKIHDSFPLMDGRKAVGGKVEIKIRIRNPVVTKQVEKVEEKWLIIKF